MPSLRYAILQHQFTGGDSHFDLLFETAPGSSLATWRSAVWPIEGRTEVTRIKDHRRIFLDYEGEISGGRGYVTRVAGGDCEVDIGESQRWVVRLISGTFPQTLIFQEMHADAWCVWPGADSADRRDAVEK